MSLEDFLKFIVTRFNILRRGGGLILISLMALLGRAGAADDHGAGEYQLKSAFLLNFTKFVDWPATPGETNNLPFIIGVLGDDNFGKRLEDAVRAETAHDRPITVRRFKKGDDLSACQILFVSRSVSENLASWLRPLQGLPVLTVGEAEGLANRDVMINLLVVQGSIKMEINPERAKSAKLEISSRLLGLAKIVDTP